MEGFEKISPVEDTTAVRPSRVGPAEEKLVQVTTAFKQEEVLSNSHSKLSKNNRITQDTPTPTSDTTSSGDQMKSPFNGTAPASAEAFGGAGHRMHVAAAAFLVAMYAVYPGFIVGVLCGLYVAFMVYLYVFASESLSKQGSEGNQQATATIEDRAKSVSAANDSEKFIYKGWMNLFNQKYNARAFNVQQIETVFVALDGTKLTIFKPETPPLKHAFHAEDLKELDTVALVEQHTFDLQDATVKLRPRNLARRRWFSRKYPICIRVPCSQAPGSLHDGTALAESTGKESKFAELAAAEPPVKPEDADGFASDSASADGEYSDDARAYSLRPGRKIYLFARSGREKERWFFLLRQRCSKYSSAALVSSEPAFASDEGYESLSLERIPDHYTHEYFTYVLQSMQFSSMVSDVLHLSWKTKTVDGTVSMDLGRAHWLPPNPMTDPSLVSIANFFASRILFDLRNDQFWLSLLHEKIQAKMATAHLPYYLEIMELKELDLGKENPEILRVDKPRVDEWGLWLDCQVRYRGSVKVVLETHADFRKAKTGWSPEQVDTLPPSIAKLRLRARHYEDEDIPESPEVSPDEDLGKRLKLDDYRSGNKATRKIVTWANKLAHSKLVKGATEVKPIRKAMEKVSETPLIMNVEFTSLDGEMTLNFPPTPSDRIWYGFRKPPTVSMNVSPQLGDQNLPIGKVSTWIQEIMVLLIEKNLVLPNMDDLQIPFLASNELLHVGLNR